MMGGVSPETCWASYEYGIMDFDTLLHLVGFFCCVSCTMMHCCILLDFFAVWVVLWCTVASCWIFCCVSCTMMHCCILLEFFAVWVVLWYTVASCWNFFAVWVVLWCTVASCWICFAVWVVLWCTVASCWIFLLCELYYAALLHLIGFFFAVWVVLWCTDPRTSSLLPQILEFSTRVY